MADLRSEIYEAKQFPESIMKPPLDGTASTLSTSAKSEISSEIGLTFTNGSLKTEKTHQFQLRTESSCSNSSIKIEENIRSHIKRDNQLASRLEERTTSSGESENILSTEVKSLIMRKNKSEFPQNKSPECSMKKSGKYDQDTFGAGFDLNEDFNANGLDDLIEPVSDSISSHSVIHVIAKTGIPRGLPIIPLKFEGRLDWKGYAETSAFRRTHSRDYSSKGQKSNFMGFDLNVSAEDDNPFNGSPQDSRFEIGSERAESLGFDLNCLYTAADELTHPILPREPEKPRFMDSNLNVNAAIQETGNTIGWLGHDQQFLVNKNSNSENPRTGDFNCNAYLANPSATRHAYEHAPSQQYFVAAPNMQRVTPFFHQSLNALPPQSYPSPFHYSGTMPCARYSNEHGFFHEWKNPDTFHASTGVPHHLQVALGNISTSTTKDDAGNEEYLSRNGSIMNEAQQFPYHAKSSQPGEHVNYLHQKDWYASNMKRKEPEGGLEFYHPGYKQMA